MIIDTVDLQDGSVVHGYSGEYIFEIINETHDYYESKPLEQWSGYFKDAEVILDIGANLGNHSLYWFRHLCPQKIYAFEPLADNFKLLEMNLRDNNATDVICPIEAAVGERRGVAVLQSRDDRNMGATSFSFAEDGEGVPAFGVDDFAAEQSLTRMDLLKIDAEGAEIAILRGAAETLRSLRPLVWVEVTKETGAFVLSYLSELKYSLVALNRFNCFFAPDEREQPRVGDAALFVQLMECLTVCDGRAGAVRQLRQRAEESDGRIRRFLEETESLKAQKAKLSDEIAVFKAKTDEYQNYRTHLLGEISELETKNEAIAEQKRALMLEKEGLELEKEGLELRNEELSHGLGQAKLRIEELGRNWGELGRTYFGRRMARRIVEKWADSPDEQAQAKG